MADLDFVRSQVVALKAAGFSYAQITEQTGKPKSFIERWVKRQKRTGGVKRKKGSGRPKKLTTEVLSVINRSLKSKSTGQPVAHSDDWSHKG